MRDVCGSIFREAWNLPQTVFHPAYLSVERARTDSKENTNALRDSRAMEGHAPLNTKSPRPAHQGNEIGGDGRISDPKRVG
ncbi:MAG: hypothetical protein RB191_13780 [Terriglobia bacterium]|nr:hypothetical protein [Terriglobia bacterium]